MTLSCVIATCPPLVEVLTDGALCNVRACMTIGAASGKDLAQRRARKARRARWEAARVHLEGIGTIPPLLKSASCAVRDCDRKRMRCIIRLEAAARNSFSSIYCPDHAVMFDIGCGASEWMALH